MPGLAIKHSCWSATELCLQTFQHSAVCEPIGSLPIKLYCVDVHWSVTMGSEIDDANIA